MTFFERRLQEALEQDDQGGQGEQGKERTSGGNIEKLLVQCLKQPNQATDTKLAEIVGGGKENIKELLDLVEKYEIQKGCDLGPVKLQLQKFAKDGVDDPREISRLFIEPMHNILAKSIKQGEKRKENGGEDKQENL